MQHYCDIFIEYTKANFIRFLRLVSKIVSFLLPIRHLYKMKTIYRSNKNRIMFTGAKISTIE